jgi:hypothetical protein
LNRNCCFGHFYQNSYFLPQWNSIFNISFPYLQKNSLNFFPWLFLYGAGSFDVFVSQIQQQNYLVLFTSFIDVYLLFVVICLCKKFSRWKI